MTAPAKVPNEDSDWHALDIFVFTNGQQHTPPRKYHLTAQELNWWNNILSFLARSQYGSLNSTIDLYTVEGQKLDGPLELIDGSAYVAVKPPDQFIDTGYSKYLIKASRSWEKSQARRSNSIEIIKPEGGSGITAYSNFCIAPSNKKVKDEIGHNAVFSEEKVIERPHACLNVHEYPQRDSSLVLKHIQKKRISPSQRSSILRKSQTASSTRKDSIKSKDEVKINAKGPIKINDRVNGNHNSGYVNKSRIPLKIAMPYAVTKSDCDQREENVAPRNLKYTNLNTLIKEPATDNKNEEQDSDSLESNIYKPADYIPSLIVSIDGNHIANKDISKNLSNIAEESHIEETIILSDVDKTVKNIDLHGNAPSTPTFEKELDEQEVHASQMQRTANVSFRENPESNYVVIGNGDRVNLKLQIEVINGDTAICRKVENEHKTYSSPDIVKTERGSQINLETDITVQNKSLQSIFYSENLGMHRNSGLVIVKCPCCPSNSMNMSNITGASNNENKKFVMLLPIPEYENNLVRCQCHDKIEEIDKESSDHEQKYINPVKKAASTIALEILKNTDELSEITITTVPNTVKSIITSPSEYENSTSETKHRVAIKEYEVIGTTFSDKDCAHNNCNEKNCCTASKNTGEDSVSKVFVDKAVQTDLCSLLVQARYHEDGRYSFHLPPLEVLKYYKF